MVDKKQNAAKERLKVIVSLAVQALVFLAFLYSLAVMVFTHHS